MEAALAAAAADPDNALPITWEPRPYQVDLWEALLDGCRRADVVAHRRWGKDEVALHWAAWGGVP